MKPRCFLATCLPINKLKLCLRPLLRAGHLPIMACFKGEGKRIHSSTVQAMYARIQIGGNMKAVLHGPLGSTILETTLFTFGSSPDNSLVIDNIKVSAHHAEIRLEEHGFSITDLGRNSAN